MTILGSVIEPPPHFSTLKITQFAHSCRIGFQPVGHDGFGFPVTFQRPLQEPQSRAFVPLLSKIVFQNLTFMIKRTPQIVPFAIDFHKDFIDVPALVTVAVELLYSASTDLICKHRPEPVPPEANRLVADVDAAFEKKILDVPQAKRISNVHHHNQADDFIR